MKSFNYKPLQMSAEAGQKVAIRVSNACTQFANAFSPPNCACDAFHLLRRSKYDLEHLLRTSKELVLEDPRIVYELTNSISRVVSSKAVLEKKVGELAQILALSVRAFKARLLDFEHIEADLETINDYFRKVYFEARYGDYLFSPVANRLDLESFGFRPCVTRDFEDPNELANRADFDELARRLSYDYSSLEDDFRRLPCELRDHRNGYNTVQLAVCLFEEHSLSPCRTG